MPGTRVTIFGSAAGLPTRERRNTAIGLWRDEELYLIDAGEPVAAQFAVREVPLEALRAVFITHTHIDHLGGLPMLLQWLQLNGRQGPLSLFLPAEAVSAFREFLELCFLYPDLLGFDRELRPVAPGKVYDRDGLTVEAFSNLHLIGQAERLRREGKGRTGQSFSFLATMDGKRILFSGDMAKASEITELAGRADLAIVEMAHFTPEELGEALAVTELPRVVLNHIIHTLEPEEKTLPARLKAAGFGGKVIVARDGTELEV
jgi:ribonuclease BN (tRNA processing enzyme)